MAGSTIGILMHLSVNVPSLNHLNGIKRWQLGLKPPHPLIKLRRGPRLGHSLPEAPLLKPIKQIRKMNLYYDASPGLLGH